jgi:hypothetical protein
VAVRVVVYGRVVRAIDSLPNTKVQEWMGYSWPCYKRDGYVGQGDGGVLIPYLVKIFHACLVIGYIPAIWCQVRVVFVPKPGKDSYDRHKDFRLVSLTPLLLKTMERVVVRFLRD